MTGHADTRLPPSSRRGPARVGIERLLWRGGKGFDHGSRGPFGMSTGGVEIFVGGRVFLS
jgi:hypothetical protein